jgi:hypothetical protein
MRHLEVEDLEVIADGGSPAELEPLDVFVYGHTGTYEDAVSGLVQAGNPGFRYYNVLTLPRPEWVGGDDTWLNWIDAKVRTEWNAVLVDTLGRKVLFSALGNPSLIDWSKIDAGHQQEIADTQVRLSRACTHMFIDQYWLAPADWMDAPDGGSIEHLAPGTAEAWKLNISNYLTLVREGVNDRAGGIVLVNGERQSTMPVFLENSHWVHIWPWEQSVELWRGHRRNVLSVDPGNFETVLLKAWIDYGGMISLTQDSFEQVQPFYERAVRCRKAGKVVPRSTLAK